jgi:hypothetical protein
MAIVNWHGKEYVGEPVRQAEIGDWIFRMQQHRWAAGTEIQVKQSEIAEMAAAETPMVCRRGRARGRHGQGTRDTADRARPDRRSPQGWHRGQSQA